MTEIDEEGEVRAMYEALQARAQALQTQDPSANERIFIWEEIRQAAAQPRGVNFVPRFFR
jgi:hypothetical protein